MSDTVRLFTCELALVTDATPEEIQGVIEEALKDNALGDSRCITTVVDVDVEEELEEEEMEAKEE